MKKILQYLILATLAVPASAIKCHSCLTHCELVRGKIDAARCDCKSPPREQCSSNACFVRIEFFSEEKTAIVQKGCVSNIPGGQHGCQYSSNTETIHCYCEHEHCNVRHKLNHFVPGRLPTIECCMCAHDSDHDCTERCRNKCHGNYCVVDFDGNEQGCGLGFPRLATVLRTENYLDHQGGYMCTKYESSQSHKMNGCLCTHPSGSCNELNKTRAYQQKHVIEKQSDIEYNCVSLNHRNYKQFGKEIFDSEQATYCRGPYCFISFTTTELVLESADYKHNLEDHTEFIGFTRPRYEVQAGCLKVDSDDKISVGCTVETQGGNSRVLSKHCICKGNRCNVDHLITDDEDAKLKNVSLTHNKHNTGNDPVHPNPNRLYTETRHDRYPTIPVKSGNSFHSFYLIILTALQFLFLQY